MTTFDAILPAGGTLEPEFAELVGTSNKALVKLGGQTVLARTISAVRGLPEVRRVVVAGTDEVLAHSDAKLADASVPSGGSGPDSIFRCLNHLLGQPDPPSKILIITTDLPFITTEALRTFLDQCPPESEICVPLMTAPEFLKRFPDSRSTFIPLRDGDWTAGCTYLMDVSAYKKALPHLEKVFLVRKSKVGMIRLLGLAFLVKYLRKTLVVKDVERKNLDILQCKGTGVLHSPPELAFDIDAPGEYEYAKQHLGGTD